MEETENYLKKNNCTTNNSNDYPMPSDLITQSRQS